VKLVLDSADYIAQTCGVAVYATEGKDGTTVTETSKMVYVSYNNARGAN